MPKLVTGPYDVQEFSAEPVGSIYRLFRLITGLSVRQFAKRINISPSYWSDLENGISSRPSQEIRDRLSKLTGLSKDVIDYLIEENPKADDVYKTMIDSIKNYLVRLRIG